MLMEEGTSAFGLIDWLVIGGYFALMIGIGLLTSRKQEDVDSFFLGGRRMPTWAVALSVLATSLSAATFIGVPQMTFGGDLTYLSFYIGGVIAAFVVAFVIIPPVYQAGTVTIYGYLEKRYGQPSVIAASCMFLFGRLLASGARLFMAAIAFALMLYGDTSTGELILAILILGFIGTLYTACGGIKAVIWTDALQIAVVAFVAALSVLLLWRAIPASFGEIWHALSACPVADTGETLNKLRVFSFSGGFAKPFTLWAAVIASTFVSTGSYGVDHDLAQRMMTTKSPFRAGVSMVTSTLLGIPVVFLFMVIGLLLSIYYGRPDIMGDALPFDAVTQTERIYPQFLLNHLPFGLKGLAMAGLFAAAMSSFDSAINAMASTAVADLYLPWQRARKGRAKQAAHALRAPRFAVVGMGILLTCFAVFSVFQYQAAEKGLINFALGVMTFASAPLLGVFLAGILTPRGNNASVLTALGVGILLVLLLQPYMLQKWWGFELAWPWWWVIVSPVCFLITAAGKGKHKQGTRTRREN